MKKLFLGILTATLALSMFFTFTGCKNDPDPDPGPAPVTTWTVTYNRNGWTDQNDSPVWVGSAKVTKGQSVTLPVLQTDVDNTDDKEFRGWSETATGNPVAGTTYTPTKDTNLYVIFTALIPVGQPITIAYNANGWTGSGVPTTAADGTSGTALTTAQLPTLTSTANQRFVKWALYANGSGPDIDTDYAPRTNITLYAIFEELVNIKFFNYYDATDEEGRDLIETIVLISGQSFEAAGETELPTATARTDLVFGYWQDEDGIRVTLDSSFINDKEVYGIWWTTTYTGTTGAEKVRLINGGVVLYEFDLKGTSGFTGTGPNGDITVDDLAKITGITLKQQLTEAELNTKSVRAFRAFGPYAYNEDDFVLNQTDWSTGDIYQGDFKNTAEGIRLAKMNGSGAYSVDDIRKFNKFHPYMIYNGTGNTQGSGQWTSASETSAYTDAAGTTATAVTGGGWFTVTYPLVGTIPASDTGGTVLGQTLLRIKTAGIDLLPPGTNYNKVYFGFGPSTADGSSTVEYLFKDVKLTWTNGAAAGTPIDGEIPEWDTDNSTWDQTFAAYENNDRHILWRGDPDDPIVDRTGTTTPDPVYAGPKDQAAPATGGKGHFFLRLGAEDWHSANKDADTAIAAPQAAFAGNFTEGPLTVDFNAQNQMLSILLTPLQRQLILDSAGPVVVTVDGEAASDSAEYRLGIGTLAGSGWNITNLYDNKSFDDIVAGLDLDEDDDPTLGTTTFTFSGEDRGIATFILQKRNNATASQVVINSIKLEYTIISDVESCNCTDEDCEDDPFKLHCNANGTTIVCTCPLAGTAKTAVNQILYPGIKQSGGPKYRELADGGLFVYDRAENYDCIDLDYVWDSAKSYTITVTGRAVAASTVEAQIYRSGSPYSNNIYATGTVDGAEGEVGTFTVTVTKTGADILDPGTNTIRIRVYEKPSFIIDSVVVNDGTSNVIDYANGFGN